MVRFQNICTTLSKRPVLANIEILDFISFKVKVGHEFMRIHIPEGIYIFREIVQSMGNASIRCTLHEVCLFYENSYRIASYSDADLSSGRLKCGW